jgi:hypothetical protein
MCFEKAAERASAKNANIPGMRQRMNRDLPPVRLGLDMTFLFIP